MTKDNGSATSTEKPKSGHELINYRLDELTISVRDIKNAVCGNGKNPSMIVRLSLVEKAITGQQWFNRTCGAAVVATLIYAVVELIRG